MPSMSGWALQRTYGSLPRWRPWFLCPRCGAGLCNPRHPQGQECNPSAAGVSMPSMSGWALQRLSMNRREIDFGLFLCPRCRAVLCNGHVRMASDLHGVVSMPSMSGWALQHTRASRIRLGESGFYALDVGLGFATWLMNGETKAQILFLCPRCRAGLCNLMSWLIWLGVDIEFLCPRCRAGLCNKPIVPSVMGTASKFLCPRCRAGLCNGCLPRASVTWAFGVRCAILAGTACPGKGFRAGPAKPAADQGISARQPRPYRPGRRTCVRDHETIQKS